MTRGWLVVVAGCARFDPAEPIQLSAPGWSSAQVQTVAAAGACWNLRFGTQLEVVDAPSSDQVVVLDFNDFACWGSVGRFTPGQLARIDVCPLDHWPPELDGDPDPVRLAFALTHELGHAVGIRVEGHDDPSVMGQNISLLSAYATGSPHVMFSDEDVRLFHEAAPDFEPTPRCEVVEVVRDSETGASCRCRP